MKADGGMGGMEQLSLFGADKLASYCSTAYLCVAKLSHVGVAVCVGGATQRFESERCFRIFFPETTAFQRRRYRLNSLSAPPLVTCA